MQSDLSVEEGPFPTEDQICLWDGQFTFRITWYQAMSRKAGKKAAVGVVLYIARIFIAMTAVVPLLLALGGGPLPRLTRQRPLPKYPG